MLIKSASQVTMLGAALAAPEFPYPLWWGSGVSASVVGTTGLYLCKGTTTTQTYTTDSGCKLHTLSNSWNVSTKFALEASLCGSGVGTYYAVLYDITSATGIFASQLSTTSSSFVVLRSGQFSLTPGHVYGVSISSSASGVYTYITDASLIVFPN